MTTQIANLGKNSGGVKPNCGPTAVANLMNFPVDCIMDTFRKEFGLSNRWQGTSNVKQCVQVLKWQLCNPQPMGNENGYLTRKMSLKNFVENYCKAKGKYFIRVGGHFVAVIDQVVYDQHEIAPIAESKWVRKMVSHAFEMRGAA